METTLCQLAMLIEAHVRLGEQRLRREMALLAPEPGTAASPGLPELMRNLALTPGKHSMQQAREHSARGGFVVTLLDTAYPRRIRLLLGDDAPPVLYCRGNPALFTRPGISIIGTRCPTPLGTRAARAYARALAEAGRVTVSGNAPGIDAAAHDEALRAGGSTIVFPPTSMDEFLPRFVQPASPRQLLVASPFAPGQTFRKYYPLRRNQLVAALAQAALVAETGTRGGTLNTVRHVRRLGRPLFVVCMPEDARHSRAPELLIATGATGVPPAPSREIVSVVLAAAAKPLPRGRVVPCDFFATDGTP